MTGHSKTETLRHLRQAAIAAHSKGDSSALGAYARYLSRAPQDAPMWSNFGVLMRKQGRYPAALRAQQRAQTFAPNDIGLRNNYANILSDLGHYADSIAAREWILAQRPDDVNQKALIGRCLRGQGAYDKAVAYLKDALKDHPDHTELSLQLAFAQLGAGDYRAAFETYRVRWTSDEMTPRDMPYPEWQGEPLNGKTVLVMPEQGFGDAILFARFVPSLKAAGARVLFMAEKPVAPLFDGQEGADWVGTSLPKSTAVDYWINAMDMARVHFAQSDEVPSPAQLNVPSDSKDRAATILAPFQDVLKVGVVWTGSLTYKGNGFRSFHHTDMLPLLDVPGVQLVSLYKGAALDAFYADGTNAFILDAAGSERHFGDSAAMMQSLDLVISSDTATLHLAGSLGIPTWGVLHWDPFWVWRHTGDTTRWYPGMRLFRQRQPLDWSNVIAEVASSLGKFEKGAS